MKTTLTKALITFLMLTVLMTLSSCFLDDLCIKCEDNEPTLVLTSSELTLNVNDTEQISITNNIEGKKVIWYSDNEEIVTVDENGIITAHAGGIAKIIAKIGKLKAICNIIVKPDVFIAGTYYDYPNIRQARLWKNEELIPLTEEVADASASSVYVNGKDVYVAGRLPEGAVVWKNGVYEILPVNSSNSGASSVFVYENDVYVGGYDNGTGKIWKNGTVIHELSCEVNSIFVHENNVYSTCNSDSGLGKLLKNGIEVDLSNPEIRSINHLSSVYVKSNGDVYCTGKITTESEGKKKAVYWKNGMLQSVTETEENFSFYDIFVAENNDVHIVGSISEDYSVRAAYWKNGVIEVLTIDDIDIESVSIAFSVTGHNNNIYIVGTSYLTYADNSNARFWKNGEEIDLGLYEGLGNANDIFVR